MKLYLISQIVNNGYDTYGAAVVAAQNETEAKHTHPRDDGAAGKWDGRDEVWGWTDIKNVTARYIGDAAPSVASGVVLADFRAG